LTIACGLALLGLTAFPAAGQAQAQGPASWQWSVSTPEEQGLDPKLLAEVVDFIRKGELLPRLHDLVVVRHGRLVLEENFHGDGPGKEFRYDSSGVILLSAMLKARTGMHADLLPVDAAPFPATLNGVKYHTVHNGHLYVIRNNERTDDWELFVERIN